MKSYYTILVRYLSFLLLLPVVNSCEGWFQCVDGNGRSATENRATSSFNAISHSGDYDVEVNYGATTTLKVTADDNLLEYIETFVRNNTLIIETDEDRCLNSQTPISISIQCPYIDNIIASGEGDLEMYDMVSDNLNITLSGTGDVDIYQALVNRDLSVVLSGVGDVYMVGKAYNSSYTMSGQGDIRAENLRSTNCNLVLSGTGNVHTYVYEYLSVLLSGSGNVYYYGNPVTVKERITGYGQIIER